MVTQRELCPNTLISRGLLVPLGRFGTMRGDGRTPGHSPIRTLLVALRYSMTDIIKALSF